MSKGPLYRGTSRISNSARPGPYRGTSIPEISKRPVSVSYLGGPIKKLSENARCPFLIFARKSLNFARKSLNFSDFARKSLKSPRTLGVRFLIIKKRETPKTLCFLCRTFLVIEVPLYLTHKTTPTPLRPP